MPCIRCDGWFWSDSCALVPGSFRYHSVSLHLAAVVATAQSIISSCLLVIAAATFAKRPKLVCGSTTWVGSLVGGNTLALLHWPISLPVCNFLSQLVIVND